MAGKVGYGSFVRAALPAVVFDAPPLQSPHMNVYWQDECMSAVPHAVCSLNKGMFVVDRYQEPRRIRAKGRQGNRSR